MSSTQTTLEPAQKEGLDEAQKWIIGLYCGLLFLLVSSPFLYKLTGQATELVGFSIASEDGCPNIYGLILHAIVFVVLVRLIMLIPKPDI